MIPLPQLPKIREKKENKAIFEISPLYPGYGVTIGNTYRRVLLSSLEGTAITAVKIKNVEHEFSSLPGVLEDIVIILMNLKKVRLKMFGQEPQIITLVAKGEREVKAGDFKTNPNVRVVSPDVHIATLTSKNAHLEIEARVEKGVGYLQAEEMEEKKSEVGLLPIDAIFTPIKKVNFRIENVRVGKRTDFDKLELEIETDGTITPEEAFREATEILLKHFTLFAEFDKDKQEKKEESKEDSGKKESSKEQDLESIKKTKIEDLDISERTKNVLLKSGIKTVGGLMRKSEQDLLQLEGMGEKGVEEIKKTLKKMKIELK